MFLERKLGFTERPRSLNKGKAETMAIVSLINDMACEFACAETISANVLRRRVNLAFAEHIPYTADAES